MTVKEAHHKPLARHLHFGIDLRRDRAERPIRESRTTIYSSPSPLCNHGPDGNEGMRGKRRGRNAYVYHESKRETPSLTIPYTFRLWYFRDVGHLVSKSHAGV